MSSRLPGKRAKQTAHLLYQYFYGLQAGKIPLYKKRESADGQVRRKALASPSTFGRSLRAWACSRVCFLVNRLGLVTRDLADRIHQFCVLDPGLTDFSCFPLQVCRSLIAPVWERCIPVVLCIPPGRGSVSCAAIRRPARSPVSRLRLFIKKNHAMGMQCVPIPVH